ncbi:hypothetical protein CJU89_2565 [Yarrowia sp. B02]|nr:hypothetical protein CJU89_2565 [Yarrowia sp. B02]
MQLTSVISVAAFAATAVADLGLLFPAPGLNSVSIPPQVQPSACTPAPEATGNGKRSLALLENLFCTKKCFKLSVGLNTCQGLKSCECQFLDGFEWTQKCLACAKTQYINGIDEINAAIAKCHPVVTPSPTPAPAPQSQAPQSEAPPAPAPTTLSPVTPACLPAPGPCTPAPSAPANGKRFLGLLAKKECQNKCLGLLGVMGSCWKDPECICAVIRNSEDNVNACIQCTQQYNMNQYMNVRQDLMNYVQHCAPEKVPAQTVCA